MIHFFPFIYETHNDWLTLIHKSVFGMLLEFLRLLRNGKLLVE